MLQWLKEGCRKPVLGVFFPGSRGALHPIPALGSLGQRQDGAGLCGAAAAAGGGRGAGGGGGGGGEPQVNDVQHSTDALARWVKIVFQEQGSLFKAGNEKDAQTCSGTCMRLVERAKISL